MGLVKGNEQQLADGSMVTNYFVDNVIDINSVVEVINYFAGLYGVIGDISVKHKNASGNFDFLGEYENVDELISTFNPQYNQFLQQVDFSSLQQYVYFTLYPQQNQVVVNDRTKPMGPKFYSDDPKVYNSYFQDDYGTILRFNKNNRQFYSLGENGEWIKNNYYYGKMMDGDLTEIEYIEGSRGNK